MRIKSKGVTLDIRNFEKDVQGTLEAVKESVTEQAKDALDSLLNDLKSKSSPLPDGKNKFDDYEVLVENTGKNRSRVFVYSPDPELNIFDVLDAGAPDRPISGSANMPIPIYNGRRTTVNSMSADKGKNYTGGRVIRQKVSGFDGRNFYKTAAKSVKSQIRQTLDTKSRRFPAGYKIKGVSVGGRFAVSEAGSIIVEVDGEKI